jgi:hypothetical protein
MGVSLLSWINYSNWARFSVVNSGKHLDNDTTVENTIIVSPGKLVLYDYLELLDL